MVTVREQPTEPVQPAWILRSDVKQTILDAFVKYVDNQASWVDEKSDIDKDVKDPAVIALAQINGALQMIREALEEICE